MRIVLGLLLALAGTVYGGEPALENMDQICSIMYDRRAYGTDRRATVTVTNGGQQVTNGDPLKVEVALADEGGQVHSVACLAVFDLGTRRKLVQDNACVNSTTHPGPAHTASCSYNISSTSTTTEKIQVRIAVSATIQGNKYLIFTASPHVLYQAPRAGAAHVPSSTTTTVPTSTKKSEKGNSNQNEAVDPHDSKMEAFLAAKYAEQKQKMAEDEDKNSEGDWQKLEEEDKRRHEEDVQREMEEYERRLAEEKQRREAMIREEMRDKEEHERDEVRQVQQMEDEVEQPAQDVDNNVDNEILVGSSESSAGALTASGIAVFTALVATFFM